WIQVELPVAKFINVFSVGARSDGWCVAAPRDYALLGSNDGTTWTQLFSISNSNTFSGSELRTHELTHNALYKFYRLNISNPNESVLTFARWDLILKEIIQEY
ncbi:MAG: discoidin domain-containing protein, partial [Alphaproteobacteria bacterium]|nr:discoidin domain-containing protein [Alphaproteobacteria bacterium]